jgi:hypothetical protein
MRTIIVLKSDPTLNRALDTELSFYKKIFKDVFIYGVGKPQIIKRLSDLYPLVYDITVNDNIVSDFGDQVFFGGVVTEFQYKIYKLFSDHTNNSGKLYFRAADSEVMYNDILAFLKYRIEICNKKDEFFKISEFAEKLYNTKSINYDNVFFIKNGNSNFCKWRVKEFKQSKVLNSKENSIYLGDNLIFDVKNKQKEFNFKFCFESVNKFIHIGFFKTAGLKKEKLFHKFDLSNILDLYCIGLKSTDLNYAIELNKPLKNREYFELLNLYSGYLFLGKGDVNSELTYVNKTIYDCFIAKIPIFVYSEIDKNKKLFPNIDCYFSNQQELERLFEMSKEFCYRLDIVKSQEKIINKFLNYSLNYKFE